MTKVRWGILGAGNIAQKFARDIAHTSSAELQAVGAREIERARTFAHTYGLASAHGSYEALFADRQVDAIYVATPHSFHLEQSIAALRAGKPVLCEKPLTPNLEDSKTLVTAARDLDVYLMEALWSYFLPAIGKARQWLDQGRIGELTQVRADFGFKAPFDPDARLFNPALAGGALLDIGIYPIALSRLVLGQGPNQVHSLMKFASTSVDDEVYALFQTGEVTSVLTCSFRSKLANLGTLVGTRGRIELPRFWQAESALLYEGDTLVERFEDQRKGGGFEFEIEAASTDILQGRKQSQIMPHALSLALQEDMARVRKAGHA
jgi:predicted dehydrogenase